MSGNFEEMQERKLVDYPFPLCNARVLFGYTLYKSAVSFRLEMSFDTYWETMGFTYSHHFCAKSRSDEKPSLCTDCHAMFLA
jgi:hypothetical protein